MLTREETEVYITIVKRGTMDDMFDFAYALGRERLAREQLEYIKERHGDEDATQQTRV